MARSGEHAVVLGGGVIGGWSAWYLAEAGYRVTVIDRAAFGAGCSQGNCGYVCPSHVLPLAMPGAVRAALPDLLKPNGALKIRPNSSPDLWRWLWRFWKCCNRRDMLRSGQACHALLQSSRALYQALIERHAIECEWQRQGLVFVFESRRGFEHYAETDRLLREEFGVAATAHESEALARLEPALRSPLGGGWHYEGDAHLRPDRLMAELRRLLLERGVTLIENSAFESFRGEAGRARAAVCEAGSVEADQFVVATGAWTPMLKRALGCRIPIQPGKGYALTIPEPRCSPRLPMIFEEHRVAVTPLIGSLRIGSTMEFSGYDASLNPKRLQLLRDGARRYLRDVGDQLQETAWAGWRPMTWDGRPIIDHCPAWSNVVIAAGHSMLGLSMGPGTGKLVAELITESTPHVAPEPYRLARLT